MRFFHKDIPDHIKSLKPLNHLKIKMKSGPVNVTKPLDSNTLKACYLLGKTCELEGGVGIAAPQIGIFLRIFLMKQEDGSYQVYFNPSFKATDSTKVDAVEGCLSVPNGVYNVSRYQTIEATWYEWNEAQNKFCERKETLTDFPARVFQHENAHLNGVSIFSAGSLVTKKTT